MRLEKTLFALLLIIIFINQCKTGDNVSIPKNKYIDLVQIFNELRKLHEPILNNGVPDYSIEAMAKQYSNLKDLKIQLTSLDTSAWIVSNRVDYHLVKGEMAAFEFHHRTLKPWSRYPGFYSFRSGDAGASMNVEHLMRPMYDIDVPLSENKQDDIKTLLEIVPEIFSHARKNLTNGSYDLAELAIRNGKNEAEMFLRIADDLAEHHPALSAGAERAAKEIIRFGEWLAVKKHAMEKLAGSGKKDYTWWMKNVQLVPHDWDTLYDIIWNIIYYYRVLNSSKIIFPFST